MRLSLRHKVGIILISVLIFQLVALSVVNAAPAAQPMMPGPGMPAPIYHVVRFGETLFSIGRLYGVNPWWVARSNGIPNPNIIFAGQVLVIFVTAPGPYPWPSGPYSPGSSPWPGGWNGCATYHTVRWGDTLFSIARRYGCSVWSIARANSLFNPHLIFVGQVLCIPAAGPFMVM